MADDVVVNQRALSFFDELVKESKIFVVINDGMCLNTDSTEFVDEDNEPLVSIPLWSESFQEDAKAWAKDQGMLEEMPLSYLVETFIPQLEENFCTVGLNWDKDGVGREFTPFDVARLIVEKTEGNKVELPDYESGMVEQA